MPLNFEQLGAKAEDIPKLVKALCYGDGRGGSISGFVTLNEDDCTKIYQMMACFYHEKAVDQKWSTAFFVICDAVILK